MELWELRQRQSLPLEAKIQFTQSRIREWYDHWEGQVYISFSGGKDSTVLLHLVRQLYPKVPAVFVDTGLEFPEIRQFVKTVDNVVWLKPKMNFKAVIEKYGWPMISKHVAGYISEVQNSRDRDGFLVRKRLTGICRDGAFRSEVKIPDKWQRLIDGPFKISDYCCDVMKKNPAKDYEKESKRKPFIGVMASDSDSRKFEYLQIGGCNAFDLKRPKSMPLSIWLESDIWEYLKKFNIPYSSVYDMGYRHTGCIFCMFGAHMEGRPNRFEKMKITHPKLWNYCMFKLGMAEVLDYIGVGYNYAPLFILELLKDEEIK